MAQATIQEIQDKAMELSQEGAKWHFHILTPGCDLNEGNDFVLVLESASENVLMAHHSNEIEKGADAVLVRLLHGDDVLDQETTDEDYRPSRDALQIIDRVKQLSDSGKPWHHHMLFPDCKFNHHAPKWTLMLEDPENNEVLQSLSDAEPKNDLKQIEALFYKK